MKKETIQIILLVLLAADAALAQCGFLAGKVTDFSSNLPVQASLSARTEQGKVRLGKTDSSGTFNVEMPCRVSAITVEGAGYQSLHMPLNEDSKPEGTYFVVFTLIPLGRQTSDAPYEQSGQKHFELVDSVKTTSLIRRIEVRDAVSNELLSAELCLFYTQKQKKDCLSLSGGKPAAEVIFTEKDIVAVEVTSAGYRSYHGNLILDKTDQEPRTYMIRLMRQQSILSVNILNAKAGMQHRLMEKNNTVKPLQRIDDGHYYAEVTPGATYRMSVIDSNNASDLSMSIDPVGEGLTLRSLRLPAAASAGKTTGPASPEKKTLYFPRSDYKLPVQSARYLDSVAVFVKSNSGKGLRITGHTDNVGNPDLNMTLSEYRVRVVTRYLVTKGVPEHLISAAGLGSRYPAVPNDSEENKRKNRRVEVQVIDLQQTSN